MPASKTTILNQRILKRQKGTYKPTKKMQQARMGIQQGKLEERMRSSRFKKPVPSYSKRGVEKLSVNSPGSSIRKGPSLLK